MTATLTDATLTVWPVTTAEALADLRGPWNKLAGDNPFRRHEWLHGWWKAYGDVGRLMVLGVWDEDRLAGLAPWMIVRTGAFGRVIRHLGTGEVCSDYLGLMARDEDIDRVTESLTDWLLAAAHGEIEDAHWDRIELSGVDTADDATRRLVERLEAAGAPTLAYPGPNCWRIELPGDWEDYLASQSKSHRKQLRRLQRRTLDTGRCQLHTAESAGELREGMRILEDLHQRRRRSLDEPGCFASASFREFLYLSAEDLLQSGLLELHHLVLDGEPIAAEFHLIGGGIEYAYQAGVDPDRLDEEPGRLINIATIGRAIERGRSGFDFLRGDEPYKAHFRAEPRPGVEYCIAAPKLTARWRHGAWQAGRSLRHWLGGGLRKMGLR